MPASASKGFDTEWTSDAALARLTTDRASDAAYEIAEAHAFRGEVDEAFARLNRVYQRKDVELSAIKG